MKHYYTSFWLGLSALFFSSSNVQALEIITGEVNDDLYYDGGVIFADVTQPDSNASIGQSTYTLAGNGTVTVGSRTGGGYPRLLLFGGTTVVSSRDWTGNSNTSWWDGTVSPPGKTRVPDADDITGLAGSNYEPFVVDAFRLGLANETFSYSVGALVAFAVAENDNQKLYVAHANNNAWKVNTNDFCVVGNGLCVVEVSKFGDIALVKKHFQSCPTITVANGSLGSKPNCTITCDAGFRIDDDGNACLSLDAEENTSDDQANDSAAVTSAATNTSAPTAGTIDSGYSFINSEEIPSGYLLYRGERERMRSQSAGQDVARSSDDEEASLMEYLWMVRNFFGNNNTIADVDTSTFSEQAVVANDQMTSDNSEADESTAMHSSGPLLPSTGGGFFLTFLIGGLVLMIMGGMVIRRN